MRPDAVRPRADTAAAEPERGGVEFPTTRRPEVSSDIHSATFDRAKNALMQGKSVLVLGESGSGKSVLGNRLAEEASGRYNGVAIASYSGALKATLISIANQLDIPTTNENDKPLSADGLREEILANCNSKTLIVADNAERWSSGLRYWLEGMTSKGVVLILLASRHLEKDIFNDVTLTLHLEPVPEFQMRSLISGEAQRHGLRLNTGQLAAITSKAGGNITRAKYLVQQLQLGDESEIFKSSGQYKSIVPFLMAGLAAFSILRYLANGDPAMRLIGGVALVLYIVIKQLNRT